jgi:hypothetical protein
MLVAVSVGIAVSWALGCGGSAGPASGSEPSARDSRGSALSKKGASMSASAGESARASGVKHGAKAGDWRARAR